MDPLQVVLFLSIVVGICLVFVCLVSILKNGNNSIEYYYKKRVSEIQNTQNLFEISIKEMQNTINEFEEYSKSVFEEIDQKYNELLFLYKLIDEKKREMSDTYVVPSKSIQKQFNEQVNFKQEKLVNSKNKDIIELSKAGLSISDIAKRLNMGQGEVKIILGLTKVR